MRILLFDLCNISSGVVTVDDKTLCPLDVSFDYSCSKLKRVLCFM